MAGQRPERRGSIAAVPADRVAAGWALVEPDELTRALTELGLSQNESRLYLALLRLADATAAELARESGVPRPKVYEALGALETRGFCSTVADRVTRYRPIPPDSAIRDWIRHRDHERATQSEREQTLADTLVRLLPKPQERAGQPPDYIEAISGRARLTEALEDLVHRAQKTVWMMMQPPWLQPRSRWNLAEAAAARRGVQVRVIYSTEALRDRKRYIDLVEAGGECRVLPEIPMKLLVRDGVEALVSLRDRRTGHQTITTVAVRHPDLARPLGLLFRQEWKKATPIDKGGT
jgi:sugar-specific transcriptional regulator TrmB